MGFEFFNTLKNRTCKVRSTNKNNAYKEMQDAQNAWRYDIQCMKGPTKIKIIRTRTKRVKAQP